MEIKKAFVLFLYLCLMGFQLCQSIPYRSKYRDKVISRTKDWSLCPKLSFVKGILLNHATQEVAVFCADEEPGNNIDDHLTVSSPPNSTFIPEFSPNETSICDGFSVGAQVRTDKSGQRVIKVQLLCLGWDEVLSLIEDRSKFRPGTWQEPQICERGRYMCGMKLASNGVVPSTGKIKCCKHAPKDVVPIKLLPQIAAKGQVLSSIFEPIANKSAVLHYFNEIDAPYFYGWSFCPPAYYVQGMKLNFKSGGLAVSCRSITETLITEEVEGGTHVDAEYSDTQVCDGAVIGYQVETLGERISKINIICSASGWKGIHKLELDYEYEHELNNGQAQNNRVWQPELRCGKQEAICGFKLIDAFSWKSPKALKMKCCHVAEVSQLCIPRDKYELVTECDASDALAPTTCQYSRTVGFTVTKELSRSQKKEKQLHESLGFAHEETERRGRGENRKHMESASKQNSLKASEQDLNTQTDTTGRTESDMQGQAKINEINRGVTVDGGLSLTLDVNTGRQITNLNSDTQGSRHTQDGSERVEGTETNTNKFGVTHTVSNDNVGTSGISSSGTRGQTHTATNDRSDETRDSSGRTSSSGNSRSNTTGRGGGANGGRGSSSDYGMTAGIDLNAGVSVGVGKVASVSADVGLNFGFSANLGFSSDTNHNFDTGSERSTSTSSSSRREHENVVGQTDSFSSTNEVSQQSSRSQAYEKETGRSLKQSTARSRQISRQKSNENLQTNSRTSSRDKTKTSETEVGSRESKKLETLSKSGGSIGRTDQNTNRIQSIRTGKTINEQEEGQTNESESGVSTDKSTQMNQEENSKWTKEGRRGLDESRSSGLTTSYDWSATDSSSWSEETAVTVSLTVPPGVRTKLFQVVGYCSFYKVQTSAFKRVDEKVAEVYDMDICREDVNYFHDQYVECMSRKGNETVETDLGLDQDYEDFSFGVKPA